MIEEVYTEYREYYSTLEVAYGYLKLDRYEWKSLHLRYFIYYLRKYDIHSMECFTSYHYKVSYRGYLEEIVRTMIH
ncbi:sigma(X)-activator ComW [Streptococcus sp. DD10]|uniref:sigma(X)-activator ComW n=1 Tax=Streptococcus sp. DD10 TaxID=1777878 RepID=UPI000AD08354